MLAVCRERLQDLYVRLHDLIDYNELNKEGFRKALKKHDKVLSRVAPKRLDDERPRWEAVLSETSKEKLQVYSSLSTLYFEVRLGMILRAQTHRDAPLVDIGACIEKSVSYAEKSRIYSRQYHVNCMQVNYPIALSCWHYSYW